MFTVAVGSTVADGCIKTHPIILGIPSAFLANLFGLVRLYNSK